jgi:threonine/homoserine/homoserine lactone efflux protein
LATSDLLILLSIGLAQLLAVISPGPSFLITARTAVAQSRMDGVRVALGLGAGTVIWSAAALLGLNALFHAVPVLFMAMKFAGALFLIYIAVKIFRYAAVPLQIDTGGERLANPFLKGFLTQISNPKVAVFFGSIFFAMLPNQVPLWMTLALIFIMSFNEVWWYCVVALCFGSDAVRHRYVKAKRWIDRVTGLCLGALGLRLLWSAGDAL